MNFPWALHLRREDKASLAKVRLAVQVEVMETPDGIWLRGPACEGSTARELAALPAVGRYERLPDGRLRRVDLHIPGGAPAQADWHAIKTWIGILWPNAALPAYPADPASLRLVPASLEKEPEIVLLTLTEWAEFGRRAPQVRLARWQFAASAERRVLVRGKPLPPLPGERYVLHGRIAIPAGWTWHPRVSVEVLQSSFGVGADALAVWSADGSLVSLHVESFVAATRSAIRRTLESADAVTE